LFVYVFLFYFIYLCTKLGDYLVGMGSFKTRNDYKVIQWIAYTTRV